MKEMPVLEFIAAAELGLFEGWEEAGKSEGELGLLDSHEISWLLQLGLCEEGESAGPKALEGGKFMAEMCEGEKSS